MPVKLKCQYCGKIFEVRPSFAEKRKFCSANCHHKSMDQKVERICEHCGKKFKTKPNYIKRGGGKYCSQKCHHDSGYTEKKCQYCGKIFKIFKSEAKKGRGKYCSVECRDKARQKRIIKTCEYCGKSFETLEWYDKKGQGRYCSKNCFYKGEIGPKRSNWNNGSSYEPYCILFNGEFKERVREFWDRKCAICGKSEKENSKRLSVHHVNFEKMSCCDVDIIPLFAATCSSCHSKTNFNREYWEEMLTNYIMIWFDGESYLPKI
jgi:uncharacterized Zn-finger protein